jgi:uncharacterized protein YndB with AHSA1/START domain
MPQKVVGETKDVGFEIGVRRTFDVSPADAWKLLTSREGIRTWLGDAPGLRLEEGETYTTRDGASGEVRVNSGRHIRITWQPPGWAKPSLIQVRAIPSRGKTVISFHQEHLAGPDERGEMRDRWKAALDTLTEILDRTEE